MTETYSGAFTKPFNNPNYLIYGALGGYVGAYAMSKYYKVEGVDPIGSYMIQSSLAGAVANYIGLMTFVTDSQSMWKGLLLGVAGEALYNRIFKNLLATVISTD